MKVGIVGKPNVGKSTFFVASTLAEAQIGNYPFTTIEANHGVAHVRVPDPGPLLGVTATPRTGKVIDGTRFVPVEIIDVAGLVPGAHEGRGLGNKFLSDLSRADVLVHVVDASGQTDAEGNPATGHDPLEDVAFLEIELDAWIGGLLLDGWEKVARRVKQENRRIQTAITEKLQGIGISEAAVVAAIRHAGLQDAKPGDYDEPGILRLATEIRRAQKPLVIALNKADVAGKARIAELQAKIQAPSVPVCAQAELALQKASQAGAIKYHGDFEVVANLNPAQQKGLDYIRDHVITPFGSTGILEVLEHAVFQHLGLVPVFPVEDETHFTDKEGRVLPDCHLVPPGTTARQLAYRVHTDLGDGFIRAVDCRSKRTVGADYVVQAGDVLKIAAKA